MKRGGREERDKGGDAGKRGEEGSSEWGCAKEREGINGWVNEARENGDGKKRRREG